MMDALQHWTGLYFPLEVVGKYIGEKGDISPKDKRISELFVTWAFAKLLESRKDKSYLVGFPSKVQCASASLHEVMAGNVIADDLNFDTLITDFYEPRRDLLRVQVKRYMPRAAASTADFFDFAKRKLLRYGVDKSLNVIVWVQAGFKLDTIEFAQLVSSEKFQIGSLHVFCHPKGIQNRKCAFWQVLPTANKQWLWMPTTDEDLADAD